ncbi:MAG: YbhB/YbcL family Raf kinase inhibitor-like protein [Acetobacteraceae bacterium]|nr:YbhB/YbcL family Raf kinase inhibitor-like protein [Acetobacteraceae bacterium]
MALQLNSPAFDDGGALPRRYAHGGDNLSPPLHWSDPPDGVQSWAIVMEEPQAPAGQRWRWALYDLPPEHGDLPEGAGRVGQPTGRHAVNDLGEARYDGPEPPAGSGQHRYVFRLLALRTPQLHAPHSPSVLQVLEAARSYVLAQAELSAVYER